jgi:hypothetical protein
VRNREREVFRAERGLVLSKEKKIMSTLGWIVLIVVLLFVFGGGGLFYSRRGR